MNYIKLALVFGVYWLTACAPIQNTVNNEYKLSSYSAKKMGSKPMPLSLLISQPDAMAGYQTEQMLYTEKPFELSHFAHSTWTSSPANMLYPLMVQSLQQTHVFFAVASGPDVDKADYRLDTQVLEFQQNFITKPSTLELTANIVLTHIHDNRIVASRIIKQRINCPEDTPYGGVVAANQAAYAFTDQLTHFVVKQVRLDSRA